MKQLKHIGLLICKLLFSGNPSPFLTLAWTVNQAFDAICNTGVATATGGNGTTDYGTAVLNADSGVITTAATSTAADTSATLTITNSKIVAGSAPIITLGPYSGSTGFPIIKNVSTVSAGSCVVTLHNLDAADPLNGTLKLYMLILNPVT